MAKDKLNQLREHHDRTDLSESIETAVRDDTVTGEPMVGITVRFPKPALDAIRAMADARGVRATTLIRDLVEQGVAGQVPGDLVLSVADVQRLIAERSHPAA